VGNWTFSAEDARLLRAAPVLVHVPAWFSGGNPEGIAPLAQWKIKPAPEGDGWLAQNREAERGRPPEHFSIVKLGGKGDLQEVGFSRLRELKPFDQYITTNLWDQAVGYYDKLVEKYPDDWVALMTRAKTLLVAAPQAADLPRTALLVMQEMVRPSLSESDMFLVKSDTRFSGRLAVPRALLRNLVEKPSEDPSRITFQSSQQIIAGTLIAMVPFIE
jgi:hypothetical protein